MTQVDSGQRRLKIGNGRDARIRAEDDGCLAVGQGIMQRAIESLRVGQIKFLSDEPGSRKITGSSRPAQVGF